MTTSSSPHSSFDAYWRRYLAAHRSPVSRACHVGGVVLGALLVVAFVVSGMFFFLPLAVVPADLGARLGHRLAPVDPSWKPTDQPVWAAFADVKMSALLLLGRLRETSTPSSPNAA